MSGATGKYGLPYPTGGDPVVVHGDLQALAVKADVEIDAAVGAVKPQAIAAGKDLNDVDLLDTVRYSAGATDWAAQHYPAAVAGVVSTYRLNVSDSHGVQTFVSREPVPRMWTRNKTSGTWSAWTQIGAPAMPATYGAADANTLPIGSRQFHTAALTNGPAGMAAGLVETTSPNNNASYLLQTAVEWTYSGAPGRMWTRRKAGADWSAWGLVGPTDTTRFATPAGARPGSGTKTVRVPVTVGHNPAPFTAITSGAVRTPLRWAFPILRWRFHVANRDIRSGSTSKPDSADMTGVWVGAHDGSGGWTGTPVKAIDAFTVPAGGAVYTSPWTSTPIPTSSDSEVLIGYGYTTTAAPWEQLGTSYQSTATTDPSTGAGWTAKLTAPFDVVVEVETPATTPVVASMGDSISVGVGSTRGTVESWLVTYARTRGAVPVLGGSSGDTMLASSDLTAPKWARWLNANTARPDALVFALGINDARNGADAATLASRLAGIVSSLSPAVPTIHYAQITPSADPDTDPAEVARIAHNLHLASLPYGGRSLAPFVAAVSADGESLDPGKNADGLHPNSLGHAALAAALPDGLAPAPASGVTVTDHGTYLTLTIGD